MTPDAAPADLNARPADVRPQFLDDDFNAADGLGDWWLDLGCVDLPA